MKYLYLVIFFLLSVICTAQVASRGVFNTNSMVISLIGPSKNYLFRTDELRAGYDLTEKQFLFIIPTKTIKAQENELDMQIFQDIFHPIKFPEITIIARFKDELTSLEQYKDPTPMLLEGQAIIFGQSYNMPVQITLWYQDKIIYYTFIGTHHLEPDYIPNNVLYNNRLTGEVKFNGVDGRITGKVSKMQ